MSKKICLVSNTSWSFVRFRKDVIKSLIAARYKVLLLAPQDECTEELIELGAHVIVLEALSRKGLNPIHDIRLYYEFKSIYAREKPDLIFQYTIKPNIYSTLAASHYKIPTIAIVTGLGYVFINSGFVTFVARKLYRFAFRKAKQVWFLNRDDFDFFIRFRLVEERKAVLIPGEGINCFDVFNPELVDAASDDDCATVKFLFIGRLLYDKGIAEYVSAASYIKRLYPNVKFGILGYLNVDNPAAVKESKLNEWVTNGWVEYLGAVRDIRPTIANFDCVVLPSYREGMSTTLQESAAMAKPIIASAIPGCKELVDEGNTGYLCQVKDVDSLVQCMERMIKLTPFERKTMGLNGRKKMIDEFSVDRIIASYQQTILEFLGKKVG